MSERLRDMTEADIAPLDAVLRAAYGAPRSYVPRLRAAFESGAARTFVIDDGGAPVAMGTLHDYTTLGYVALVGVVPPFQRRGLARVLMDAIVAESAARGHTELALESSVAGRRLYDALGFAALGTTIGFTGPCGTASPGDGHVRRATDDDVELICAYDAAAFGGDRSATIRGYFADPACATFIADDGDRIGGYAVAREGTVAPLLAQTPGAAAALLDVACGALASDTARLWVPEENRSAIAVLAQRGFAPFMRNAHMALGTPFTFPRRAVYGLMSLGEG